MLSVSPNAPPASAPRADAVWIDLLDPSDDEARLVAELTGLHVPTRAELSEIESSSRMRRQGDTLYLSLPLAMLGDFVKPLGFVLSRDRLITVRFTTLPSFDAVAAGYAAEGNRPDSSLDVFLALLEGMVDALADVLERQGESLDRASRHIFHPRAAARRRPVRMDQALRAMLREVGAAGDLSTKIRDTLLGVARVAQFVVGSAGGWIGADQRVRFETLRADITSLTDFQTHLSDKVQFLLDATLGFINIEQNNTIKVLTIVSIVGIPPTFIASLYGMNFHDIPELSWSFGYWYALGVMALSAVLPLVWFRLRGWL